MLALWMIVLAGVIGVESVQAQTFSGDRNARAGLTIGPGFATGASMILDSPSGYKIKPVFAWTGEVSTTYPLTDVISSGLSLGIHSRGTRVHHFQNENIYSDTRVLFFTLYPNFTFSGFNLGFNLGLPLSGTETAYTGASSDLSSNLLNTMAELRFGGTIPIADDELGWLSVTILGGYSFSKLVDYPDIVETFGDWRNISLQAGFRFEFLIPGTERD